MAGKNESKGTGCAIIVFVVFTLLGLVIAPGMLLYVLVLKTLGILQSSNIKDIWLCAIGFSILTIVIFSIFSKGIKKGLQFYLASSVLIILFGAIDYFWIQFDNSILNTVWQFSTYPFSLFDNNNASKEINILIYKINKSYGFQWSYLYYYSVYAFIAVLCLSSDLTEEDDKLKCPECSSKDITINGEKVLSEKFEHETKNGKRDGRYKANPLIQEVQLYESCNDCNTQWTREGIRYIQNGEKTI